MNCRSTKPSNTEAGQASIVVVLMLSLFLLAALAFAVDYTNIWFQRQQAQTAADAACSAGAMDIYQLASGATLPNSGFVLGTGGSCSSYGSAGPTMCWYASKNGFNGYTGGAATVSWTFPSSVTGVTPPPTSVTQYPFMQVSVSLPVKTYFSTLLTGNQTQQVSASSTCGLTQIMQGAPIMVLNPSVSGSLYYTGGASLTIVGGPPRSIVVNSSSATAVSCGSSGVIDTRRGGPNLTGSDVGTYGGPTTAPGSASGCYGTNGNTGLPAGFSGGTTGHWAWPASPVADPYSGVPAAAGMKNVTPLTHSSTEISFPPRTTPMVVRIPTLPTTMVGDRRTIPSKGARNTPRDTIPAGSRKTGMTSLPSCPAPTIWMATWPSAAAIAYAWPSRAPIPWA